MYIVTWNAVQLSRPATAFICEAYEKQKKEIEEDGDVGGKWGQVATK